MSRCISEKGLLRKTSSIRGLGQLRQNNCSGNGIVNAKEPVTKRVTTWYKPEEVVQRDSLELFDIQRLVLSFVSKHCAT